MHGSDGNGRSGADGAVSRVVAWIHGAGRVSGTLGAFLDGLVAQVRAEGVPVDRAAIGAVTLHPQFHAMRSVWTPETGVREAAVTHEERAGVPVGSTPLGRLITDVARLRTRLDAPGGTLGLPDFEDLRVRGFTDWLGNRVTYAGRAVGGLTWGTRAPGGFTDAQLQLLDAVHAVAAAPVEVHLSHGVMRIVLRTYLGDDAGERVLRGQIRRGDLQTIRAAIWFSDLRDFTVLSSKLAPADLVSTLNEAFGPLVAAVRAHGGEVLKFIGDGLLAIFPARDGDERKACDDALAAARDARAAIDRRNGERAAGGDEEIRFGIGLHFGDAMYGNVGGLDRLDFTVIGPAVNLAARLEGESKALGRWLLVSSEFAARCQAPLQALGPRALKGIAAPVEVSGLPDAPT